MSLMSKNEKEQNAHYFFCTFFPFILTILFFIFSHSFSCPFLHFYAFPVLILPILCFLARFYFSVIFAYIYILIIYSHTYILFIFSNSFLAYSRFNHSYQLFLPIRIWSVLGFCLFLPVLSFYLFLHIFFSYFYFCQFLFIGYFCPF